MADYTLCVSDSCRAKTECTRHDACPKAFKASDYQSYAIWHPSAGKSCPGFLDMNGSFWERYERNER